MNKILPPLATKQQTPSSWKNLLRKKKSKGNLAQSHGWHEDSAPSLPRPSLTSLRSFGSSKSSTSSHNNDLPTLANTAPARLPFGGSANTVDSLGRRRAAPAPEREFGYQKPSPPFARDIDFPHSAPPDQPVFAKFFPVPDSLDDLVSRGSLDRARPPQSAPPGVATFATAGSPKRATSLSRRASVASKVPPVVTWLDKENGVPALKPARARQGTLAHGDGPLSAPASVQSFPELPPVRQRANSVAGTRPSESPCQARSRKCDSVLAKSRMSATSENKARASRAKGGKEGVPPVPPVPRIAQVADLPASDTVVGILTHFPSLFDGDEDLKPVTRDIAHLLDTPVLAYDLPSPNPECSWLDEDPFASALRSFDTVRGLDASTGTDSWDALDLHNVLSYKPAPPPATPSKAVDGIMDLSALLDTYQLDSPSFYSHESSFASSAHSALSFVSSAHSAVPSIRVTEYHDSSFEEEKAVRFAEDDSLNTSGETNGEEEEGGEIDWLELHIMLSMFPRPPPLLRADSPESDESGDVWARLCADSSFESMSTPPLVAQLWVNDLDDEVERFKGMQARRKKRHGIMFP